ncbi:ankyrin-3 [Elysia marginata]|uniref:Ankyrin-3 n=1 Tax=Elysia marginata TaxID=1093978 RepID=A0AAV4GXG5_9GAST|nr:ankyrin-3 [Elysia marginata]
MADHTRQSKIYLNKNGHQNHKTRRKPWNSPKQGAFEEQVVPPYDGYFKKQRPTQSSCDGHVNPASETGSPRTRGFSASKALIADQQLLEALTAGDLRLIREVLKQHQKGEHLISWDTLNSSLLEACGAGMKFIVQELVRSGAKINMKRGTHRTTALHMAAWQGFVDIADFLLSKGANVDAVDYDNNTALILAVNGAGSCDMLNLLLAHKAKHHYQNKQGMTALMKAVMVMDIDAVRILLYAGADVNQKNRHGKTARDIAATNSIADVFDALKSEAESSENLLTEDSGALSSCVKRNDTAGVKILLDSRISKIHKKPQHLYKNDNESTKNATLKELIKTMCVDAEAGKKPDQAQLEMVRILFDSGAKPEKGIAKRSSSSLIDSTRSGSFELVKLVASHSATNPNFLYNDRSALMIAAENGDTDILELLLSRASVPDLKNTRGETALACALMKGEVKCAEILIKMKKPSEKNLVDMARNALEKGQLKSLQFLASHCDLSRVSQSLMRHGIWTGDTKIVGFLMDHGADIAAPCDEDETALLVALRDLRSHEMLDMVKFLVKSGAQVNRTPPLDSPLVTAVENNCDSDVLRYLLEQGADVNEVGMDDGTTPLTAALSLHSTLNVTRCSDMLEVLLEAGADPNKTKLSGVTALHLAVSKGNPGMIKQLVDADADLEARSSDGLTPLLRAANGGQPGVISQLKRCRANMKVVDNNGRNALMRFLESNTFPQSETLRLLAYDIEQVNFQAPDGFTPLMQATAAVKLSAVETLLELGADPHIVDSSTNNQRTALAVLLETFRLNQDVMPCAERLIEHGALYSLPKRCYHVLFHWITADVRPTVQLIVTHGMTPLCMDFISSMGLSAGSTLRHGVTVSSMGGRKLSPLAAALVRKRVAIARYFVGNWFLTERDVVGCEDLNHLKKVLAESHKAKSVSFLDDYMSQPMSLVQLSFVAVSSQLSEMTGREDRVRKLPLPTLLQDKLLFKKEICPMDLLDDDEPLDDHDENDSLSSDYSDYNFYGSDVDFDPDFSDYEYREHSDYEDGYMF